MTDTDYKQLAFDGRVYQIFNWEEIDRIKDLQCFSEFYVLGDEHWVLVPLDADITLADVLAELPKVKWVKA